VKAKATPERLAELVAQRLGPVVREELREAVAEVARPDYDEWITANECARRWGRRPRFYRDHADEFGARRVGGGPKPRLEFNPSEVEWAFARRR
jgi:hypothetical protein